MITLAMIQWLKKLFRPDVQPMNVMTIHKKNILHNLEYLQNLHPDGHIFPVLKSNAYGHWLQQILRILSKSNVAIPYLVVDSIPEYYQVLRYSNKKILLLGETLPENYKKLDYARVTPCVWSLEVLEMLLSLGKQIRVHLFLNTWMNREGLASDQLEKVLQLLKKDPRWKNIVIEGVMSHFADADGIQKESQNLVDKQIAKCKKLYHAIIDYGHLPYYKHIGNSAGCLKVVDDFFNAWRPWFAFYGYNPLSCEDDAYKQWTKLLPAMTIASRIVAIQQVKAGESVGYSRSRFATDDCTVVTVPFGYTEWMRRNGSWKIKAVCQGKILQQVGNVCMNLSLFVLPKNINVSLWDFVELLSSDPDASNNVYARADAAQTIPYEILVGMASNMRREIIS